MEIKITLDKIQNGIMQLTAILGRNKKDMSIAVTPDTLPAIGIYIGEGVTEAENELRRHLKDSNVMSLYRNDEAVTLELKDKLRTSASIPNQTGSTLELYLIHYAIARWLGTIESASALAEAYQTSSGGYVSKLIGLVCQKDAYIIDDASYRKREKDAFSTEGHTSAFDKEEYHIRKRDLNPTGRTDGEWPHDIISTSEPGILTDKENNILVSQPDNTYEDENNN